jgi:hypothetical protein
VQKKTRLHSLFISIFYKDRQRHVVDEYGAEPMDLVVVELFAIKTSSRTQSLRNTSKRPSSPTIDEREVDLELCDTFYSDDEKTRFLKQRHQKEHVLTVRMTPIYLQQIRMARLNALKQHMLLSNNQGRGKPVVNTDAK